MPDPTKHVLDIMEGSFSQLWRKGDVGFKAGVMKSYISIFEQLLRISPPIEVPVREEAMKLAGEWKEKMRANTENSLEVLGFLQFLAMYGLVSSLNEDEILNFLGIISQNEYALELSRPFAPAYKIPEVIQYLIGRKKLIDAVRLACSFGTRPRIKK
ncbi:Frigida-like [Parasponia andersonii]|uniref:FRIGIDA-like protein n=1 Tax=Parasponia andersonii TaxID=3476 RepID=A0A2P5DL03_PARAD|nr:Frigida-like [Parasponia andersonii]